MIHRLSIRARLSALLFVLSLFTSVAYTGLMYFNLKTEILAGIDRTLLGVAHGVARLVPAEYHERATDPNSISPGEYRRLVDLLSGYADSMELAYAYTYVKPGDEFVIASTSATPGERETGEIAGYFKPYPDASDELFAAYADGKTHYEQYTDSYGTFRSIFLPLETESGRRYVIGADMWLRDLDAKLAEALKQCGLIGLGVFAGVFVLGSFVAGGIVGPLQILTIKTDALAGRDFAVDGATRETLDGISKKRPDEVGKLARALGGMLSKLEAYLGQLQETTAAKERAEGELNAARDIQTTMLPSTFPEHRHYTLHAALLPAREASGDLYCCVEMPDGRLFFAVGDASGKGVSAALFMAAAVTLFRAQAMAPGTTLAGIMATVNDALAGNNDAMMFLTACIGALDPATGEVEICDAGHDAPLRVDFDGEVIEVARPGGVALGVCPGLEFETATLTLSPRDSLLLFTDGVTEAFDPAGEMFGRARLCESLSALAGKPAEDLVAGLFWSVAAFTAGGPQSDDVTVLALRWRGPEEMEATPRALKLS